MNDTELRTAVRESVAGIHSATPVTQIIGRGRTVRVRRRFPVLAAALTAAGGTALAVTMLLPSAHATGPAASVGSRSGGVRLAAWTVARQADGEIVITINQLKNPEGLQATLRADGLPATVSFSGSPMSASCQGYFASRAALHAVAWFRSTGIVIDPSALPKGAGVDIFDEPGTGLPGNPSGTVAVHGTAPVHPPLGSLTNATDGPLAVGLVYASPQCTG
jgi:hypothetical protein